jgi:micrococcal nuclease
MSTPTLDDNDTPTPKKPRRIVRKIVFGTFTALLIIWMINILGGGEAAGNQASRAPTAPSAPATPAPLPAPVPVPAPVMLAALTVTHVADGDTVTLSDGREVRILGIDAPESVKPNAPVDCYGHEAAGFARSRLLGKSVTVTTDPSQDTTDRYGRTLAYLTLSDGRDFSVMAAEAGAGRSYVYAGKPVAKHSQIRKAEQQARTAHVGLWASCDTAATKPTPKSKADAPSAPKTSGQFKNCDAARAAGAAPVHRGEPGYAPKLDRDGDGIGCEWS